MIIIRFLFVQRILFIVLTFIDLNLKEQLVTITCLINFLITIISTCLHQIYVVYLQLLTFYVDKCTYIQFMCSFQDTYYNALQVTTFRR
jgi:hypothetical protein